VLRLRAVTSAVLKTHAAFKSLAMFTVTAAVIQLNPINALVSVTVIYIRLLIALLTSQIITDAGTVIKLHATYCCTHARTHARSPITFHSSHPQSHP